MCYKSMAEYVIGKFSGERISFIFIVSIFSEGKGSEIIG